MEGTDRTTLILDLHRRLCEQFSNVGVTLQAYLHRTPADLSTVLRRPSKVRLVKGAYETSPDIAYSRGAELDTAYRQMMKSLMGSGHACSISTHDATILNYAHQLIREQELPTHNVEFEMLKGVAIERLGEMQQQGYRTRIYLPYGKEWHLYLCNRLAEHPPNLYQAIADVTAKQRISTSI